MRVAVRGVVTSEEMGVELSRCKFWSYAQDRWIGANQKADEQQSQAQQATTTQTKQLSFANLQDNSTTNNTNNDIEQGKARFYSSTTKKTTDIGVKLSSRKNQNKHTVIDAQWEDGFKSSYVFWKTGIVEILSQDEEGKIDNTPGTWVLKDEAQS